MNINKFGTFIIAVLFVLAIGSCNKNKMEQTKHIPKDATFVVAINPMSFYGKLKDQKAQLDSLVNSFTQKMMNSDSSIKKGELAKEAFDFQKSFFFFVKTSNSIAEGKSFSSAFIVPLKDKDKFIELIKTNEANATIAEGNGFSYAIENQAVCGWNKDIAIIIPSYNSFTDSLGQKAALESLFNLKESESIAEEKSFTKSFTTQADISYFINSSQSFTTIPFLAMSKASDLVKDMYSTGTINFNDGAIDMEATSYPNSNLLDLIKKNPSEELSGKTLDNYPGKPQGIADISFNVKQIVAILNYMGLDQMITPFLQKQGLSLDDVASAFKGEIAAVGSNFRMEQKQFQGFATTYASPAADYLVCIPINNKKAYDKIVAAISSADNAAFTNQNGQSVPAPIAQSGQGFLVNDKYLILASSQSLIDSFVNEKGKISLPEDVSKNLKGKTSYFYGDLQSILSAIPATGIDSGMVALSKNTFKDIAAWGNEVSGNSFSGEAHLTFQNAKENSLITLLKYFQQVKADQDKYYKTMSIADSAVAPLSDDMNTNIPVPPNVDTSK